MYNLQMKRYALIDVKNTQGSAKSALGFTISWEKINQVATNEKVGL